MGPSHLLHNSKEWYMQLAVGLIEKQVAANTIIPLPVYIHSKLLRILTHFMRNSKGASRSWLKSLVNSTNDLVELVQQSCRESSTTTGCFAHSLLVECVACLANLMDNGLDLKRVPVLGELVKRLFSLLSIDSKEPQSDKDDLLLVSIVLVGNMARYNEICTPNESHQQMASLFWKPFLVTCEALESQRMDREMLICGLYALQQLLRHREFLDQFWPDTLVPPALNSSAIRTTRNLASLLLNGDKQLSRLSVSVLEQINQLELGRTLQESELVRLTRFEAYNEKWISTIQASRKQDLGSSSFDPLRSPQIEEETEADDDDYELSHLRALAFESGQTDEPSGEAPSNGFGNQDEWDYEVSGQEEPDLNVIDSNSMIKHLTARRELRFNRDSV